MLSYGTLRRLCIFRSIVGDVSGEEPDEDVHGESYGATSRPCSLVPPDLCELCCQ